MRVEATEAREPEPFGDGLALRFVGVEVASLAVADLREGEMVGEVAHGRVPPTSASSVRASSAAQNSRN